MCGRKLRGKSISVGKALKENDHIYITGFTQISNTVHSTVVMCAIIELGYFPYMQLKVAVGERGSKPQMQQIFLFPSSIHLK